jgi:hypothetical protein
MQFITKGRISERYSLLYHNTLDDADYYVAKNPKKFEKINKMNEFLVERVCLRDE